MRECAAALVLVVSIAACSGGSDDVAETTTPIVTSPSTTPPTSTSTTTTQPATESSTTAPTTTAPTTAPPPVTDPPTTQSVPDAPALDPLADLAASVARDAQLSEVVQLEAFGDPTAADAQLKLERYLAGSALDSALAALERFRADDVVGLANPEIPNILVLESEPELVGGADPPQVQVDTCRVDAGVIWARVGESDQRVPIDDDVVRIRARTTFVLNGDIWQIAGGDQTERTPDATTCS